MRAIFVTDDRCERNLAIARHPARIVRLAEKRIHAFEHAFGHAANLTDPYRAAKDKDVVRKNFRAQAGPFITVAFVGGYARLDVERGDPHRLADRHVMLGEGFFEHRDHSVDRAFLARLGLERAIDGKGFERHRISPLRVGCRENCDHPLLH